MGTKKKDRTGKNETGTAAAPAKKVSSARRAPWSSSPLDPRPYDRDPAFGSTAEVPPDRLERAFSKLNWIRAFVAQDCPRGMLMHLARQHAQIMQIPDDEVPPYTTLVTWVHAYLQHGILGLVDSIRSDAGRIERLHPKLERQLEMFMLGKGSRSPRRALDFLITMNNLVDPSDHDRSSQPRFPTEDDPVFVPSYHAVRTWMRRFEAEHPHEMAAATDGVKGFRTGHRIWLPPHVLRAGQRLAIDSTPADILLRRLSPEDPNTWEVFRPTLTVVEDIGSRAFVSFNLSHEGVSSEILLSLMRRAIFQECNHPGLLSTGVPEGVVVDGGGENQGAFVAELKRIGVDYKPGRGYEPTHNARVERLIGTISNSFLPQLPGYSKYERVFSADATPEDELRRRPRYQDHKREIPTESLLTMEALHEKLLAWGQVYNHRPHAGLRTDDPDVLEAIQMGEAA